MARSAALSLLNHNHPKARAPPGPHPLDQRPVQEQTTVKRSPPSPDPGDQSGRKAKGVLSKSQNCLRETGL